MRLKTHLRRALIRGQSQPSLGKMKKVDTSDPDAYSKLDIFRRSSSRSDRRQDETNSAALLCQVVQQRTLTSLCLTNLVKVRPGALSMLC